MLHRMAISGRVVDGGRRWRRPVNWALIWSIALAIGAVGCASTGARPRPFPVPATPTTSTPDRPTSTVETAETRREEPNSELVQTALSLRGVPYRNGGQSPTGFDCSGFTHYVFAERGMWLPREVSDQFKVGRSIERHEVAPGDLIFFTTTGRRVSHVAIAIGGDAFVHAPSSRGVVRVESLDSEYWAPRVIGFRRITAN